MKTWYRAVCDTHKSMCHVVVSNPELTKYYLGKDNELITNWLGLHYGCSLRFVHSDEELDNLLGVYEDACR